MIDNNLGFKPRYTLGTCPYCDSNKYILHGTYNKTQRFKCKECNRTFSARTHSPWYYSKKSNETWKKFWQLQMNNTPLKKCAKILKINIETAFNWRHKLLNAFQHLTEPNLLSETVSITKRVIKESAKGVVNPPFLIMHNIWCLLAADENDHILMKPFCRDRWDKRAFNDLLNNKVSAYSHIIAFGDSYFYSATKQRNPLARDYFIEEDFDAEDLIPDNVELVKEKVRRSFFTFNHIEDKAHGISTKYIHHYFALAKVFVLDQCFNINSVLYRSYERSAYIRCCDLKSLKALN